MQMGRLNEKFDKVRNSGSGLGIVGFERMAIAWFDEEYSCVRKSKGATVRF